MAVVVFVVVLFIIVGRLFAALHSSWYDIVHCSGGMQGRLVD